MLVFRHVALILSVCTFLLINQHSYAQNTLQPLIPAQLGGVASVSATIQIGTTPRPYFHGNYSPSDSYYSFSKLISP